LSVKSDLERLPLATLRYVVHYLYPSVWTKEVLGFECDGVQTQFINSEATDILVNCTRQWGKTTVAGYKAAHKARFNPGSEILVVSATQRQASILESKAQGALLRAATRFRPVAGKEYDILEYDPEDGPQIVRRSVLSLELSNGSKIVSTPASPDSVRGYSPEMIIVDEDARVSDDLYDAIRPMRAAHPCQLVLQTTPNGKRGHFYREWQGGDPLWTKFEVPANKCPRITKEFLERERTKMTSEAMYLQEYFCKFIELSGALLSYDVVQSMFSDTVRPLSTQLGRKKTSIMGDVRGL
jgi:Terminase large subunit, T4likevirus-type, N-terminal